MPDKVVSRCPWPHCVGTTCDIDAHVPPAVVLRCDLCTRHYVGQLTEELLHNKAVYQVVWPIPNVSIDPHKAIPDGVAISFMEAQKCAAVGAPNATALMCRRALESSMDDLKAKGRSLKPQIDSQATRLGPDLTEWAHEVIRYFGNLGAHPDPTNPAGVTVEQAGSALSFLEHYIDHIYLRPDEYKKLRRIEPVEDEDTVPEGE